MTIAHTGNASSRTQGSWFSTILEIITVVDSFIIIEQIRLALDIEIVIHELGHINESNRNILVKDVAWIGLLGISSFSLGECGKITVALANADFAMLVENSGFCADLTRDEALKTFLLPYRYFLGIPGG